ncbi:hypothetical protein [Enterococcus thailandicus]|uniref:hypothetical protein n=1 Tax=Enterococcus thailandicus TaxID=417368 RepID=UPI0028901A2C|nr:hypothetical protein [Enterococcus thailandicus]MDT2734083.1 hypothetical protein [Enterococcus thailandicus]MDT2776658.1 hypothetical protein [Enterococcus thailandicus]
MKAKKGNRVIAVDDTDKDFYKAQGYDIVELDESQTAYKVVESATGGKTYTVKQYNALLAENEKLKQRIAELENSNEPTREELKQKLVALGVEFANNTSTQKLIELLENAETKGEVE